GSVPIVPTPHPYLLVVVRSSTHPPGASLRGWVGDEAVLLLRTAESLHAVQATCPHYGAPLADGAVHDGRIHCPWHHASFSLDDGAVCRPPALDPLQTWPVEERDGWVRVRRGGPPPPGGGGGPPPPPDGGAGGGGGAAGTAAVLALREAGHRGDLLLIDPDAAAPYDRPNLSKDYLAGTAPEEWLPLRTGGDWAALDVERIVDRVVALDSRKTVLELGGGRRVPYDGLILACGAGPCRLAVPGGDRWNVFTLRSLDDSRAIRARAVAGSRAVVVGAGFIGLEAAAALRHREVEVEVIAPEAVPMARVLGPTLGAEVRALHEAHGVRFHLGRRVSSIDDAGVHFADGGSVPADFVVVGVGVEPRLDLALGAGLRVGDGVEVDRFLESSRRGVFVAGDLASFPDPATGDRLRIEHWAVAEAQGRTAAFNLLGHGRPFRHVPFFWTTQYDVTVQWSGFPRPWDRTDVDGSLAEGSMAVRFLASGNPVAAAFVDRDREGLRFEHDRAVELSGGAS
ncbi:MAG: FAD-dependent oxidoreductase, partial [Longimicrobiales bacterium]